MTATRKTAETLPVRDNLEALNDIRDARKLTADIIVAGLEEGVIEVDTVPEKIKLISKALLDVGAPEAPVEDEHAPVAGKVSERASVKPGYLISMIDGKKYKLLRRHIGLHGFTPESYRAHFGLRKDYPMTAPSYSSLRQSLAKKNGLGRNKSAQK